MVILDLQEWFDKHEDRLQKDAEALEEGCALLYGHTSQSYIDEQYDKYVEKKKFQQLVVGTQKILDFSNLQMAVLFDVSVNAYQHWQNGYTMPRQIIVKHVKNIIQVLETYEAVRGGNYVEIREDGE